jgi:hypothetical protein
MLYGIIAVFDQMPFSNDVVWNDDVWNAVDDVACARPPKRTPDRPLSTR